MERLESIRATPAQGCGCGSAAACASTVKCFIRIAVPGRLATGEQKSLAVEWAPVGAKKCLVARVEILMDADGAPKMTSFLVEDLDEVLELSD